MTVRRGDPVRARSGTVLTNRWSNACFFVRCRQTEPGRQHAAGVGGSTCTNSTTNVAMKPQGEDSPKLSSQDAGSGDPRADTPRASRVSTSNEAQDGDGASSAAAARMRRALRAVANAEESRGELEAAAKELVAELRGRDQSPEHVLLQIKQILAECGLRPSYAAVDAEKGPGREGTVYRDVIAWGIRYYYESNK